MFESYVETCIDWTSFDLRFKDFLSNPQLKIIIYCVTDQRSTSKISAIYQVISSHVSEVNDLLDKQS